ncbi:hypothetical protein PV433_30930 [Paenibacillus sp. GYB004]|uniref:hypothetical protein n=1 Tax=Paenibacillus sp. GYB004 TaxID=2994393 RepID=UPI002F96268C
MDKADITNLFKRIKRVYSMFPIPQELEAAREMVKDWHETLSDVPVEQAIENLKRYSLDPDNKFPPHPGVLAKPLSSKTESEQYHEDMRQLGALTLEKLEQLRASAVAPTEEQRAKARSVTHGKPGC